MKKLLSLIALATVALTSTSVVYADAASTEALIKDSKCSKCHAADKEKSGPSYKKIAEKYKGKADAEAKLITHLTTGPKIKVDGEEEVHAKIKSTDQAAIKEAIAFILKN